MAVRTATATDLDTKISALLTSLDAYLAVANQPGEGANVPAKYFFQVLFHHLMKRQKTRVLLQTRFLPAAIPAPTAKTVVALDPLA
ncbi:MAG: hypothetical protein ACREXS_11895 [Gammaproteobacteria bacterium]